MRSLLFAPGNHARRLQKVGTFGSDAIVLDLEDAVAESEKTAARFTLRGALHGYADVPVVIVRVNSLDSGRFEDDLRAVVCADMDCVMIPKVDDPATLAAADSIIGELELAEGSEKGRIRILPLVETAAGITRAAEIARAAPERVVTLIFGLGDFSTDMQVDLTDDGTELLYARSAVAIAARAAGMRAALDGPYLDLHNLDGLVRDTLRSKQLGFQGRVVVYPPQVGPVQRTYSEMSELDLAQARRVVDEFAAAERGGLASIQIDGRFVDYPIYRRAQNRLRLHEELSTQ